MNSYFLCATQPSNLGDLVINKMLIDELCQYGKVFVDAYHLPEIFSSFLFENQNAINVYEEYGCSLKRYQLFKVLRIVKDNQIGLYTNSPGPLYLVPPYKQIAFRFIHWLLSRQGAKVVNIGGCCSSALIKKSGISQIGIKEYFLRSTQSVEYLKSINKSVKVSYIPDLSLLLRNRVIPDFAAKTRSVAFNFRTSDQQSVELREQCHKIIQAFVDNDYCVVLYWQVANDEMFVRSLYTDFVNVSAVSLHESIVWFNNMDFYVDKQFVVSNRLHSLLIGSVYGAVPVVFGDSDVACAKISHVFSSVFNANDLVVKEQYKDGISVQKLISDLNALQKDVDQSILIGAQQCRNVISQLVQDTIVEFETSKSNN